MRCGRSTKRRNERAAPSVMSACGNGRGKCPGAAAPTRGADSRSAKPTGMEEGKQPTSLSSRLLAETSRQQSPEPVTERPRIRGPIPVEHARFVEQQVCGILLEGQIVVAERCERQDDLVARVDFQDRLGGALDAAAAGEDLLQLAIEAGFRSHQADCALGQAVRGAHVRYSLAQGLLDEAEKTRYRLVGLARALILGGEARDQRQIR